MCRLVIAVCVAFTLFPSIGRAQESANSSSDAETVAFINSQIAQGWKESKVTPSEPASEYEFLRRVYLDIIGRIPSVEEISRYREQPANDRRLREIERLLQHEDYARNWANHWTVWLMTRTDQPGLDREAMRSWLEESFAKNTPYDKFVETILTATGKTDENGAANFIAAHVGERTPNDKRDRDGLYDMVPVTSRTTRLFLGYQVQCTQCHDHKFMTERKQQQYWALNAFFRQVERQPAELRRPRRDEERRYYTVRDNDDLNPKAAVFFEKFNATLGYVPAEYLNGAKLSESMIGARRQQLAHLIIQDDLFAEAIVNRMWGHFMGRGFTDPVDDFGDHNEPSHPELLDRLAADFRKSGHDLRRLIRWIAASRTYQLTSVSNQSNRIMDETFARMQLKAMSPEQLVDSIFVATNAEETKTTSQERRELYDRWLRNFTVSFGDDEGNEKTFNGTVVQALMLMNGNQLNDAIQSKPGSTLHKAMNTASPRDAIEYLYLSALTRPPSKNEATTALRVLGSYSKDKTAAWQDIFWALLNSSEFILNH